MRMAIIALFFIACFISLSIHLYKLQVVNHDYYDTKTHKKIRVSKTTQGTRGNIFDFNSTLIACNIITQNVYLEPKRIAEYDRAALAQFISRYLDLDVEQLSSQINDVINAPVTANITCELSQENASIISYWKLPAVEVLPFNASSPNQRLVIHPKSCSPEQLNSTLERLSQFVGLSVKELNAQIQKAIDKPREIVIKTDAEFTQVEELRRNIPVFVEELKQKDKAQGITKRTPHPVPLRIVESSRRCYPQNEMMANLIGYLDGNKKGSSGIEKLFDKAMTPRPGSITYPNAFNGQKQHEQETIVIPPKNGADIYLTIQAPIQRIAEEELAELVKTHHPTRAYAIMMNPRTGAIMALAQYPTFNPNDRSTFKDTLGIQNHCMTEIFEPGSIMKSLPISYALDKGIVNLNSKFDCEKGKWKYGGRTLHDTHHNEILTVSEVLKVSSNIGTAKIALEMGPGTLYNAFRAFGLGRKTNFGFLPADAPAISFANESNGLLKAVERWDTLSITRYPIGQGIACSPLQLITAYGAIANNGIMMHPFVVDRIDDGETVRHSVPQVIGMPISQDGADKIREALITVVNHKGGTGTRAAMKDFVVAGKTGSAQHWNGKAYEEHVFESSFVGFVPAENPEFVMLISAREVKAHGGTVCGPTFKNIATRTLEYLNVKPNPAMTPSQATTTVR